MRMADADSLASRRFPWLEPGEDLVNSLRHQARSGGGWCRRGPCFAGLSPARRGRIVVEYRTGGGRSRVETPADGVLRWCGLRTSAGDALPVGKAFVSLRPARGGERALAATLERSELLTRACAGRGAMFLSSSPCKADIPKLASLMIEARPVVYVRAEGENAEGRMFISRRLRPIRSEDAGVWAAHDADLEGSPAGGLQLISNERIFASRLPTESPDLEAIPHAGARWPKTHMTIVPARPQRDHRPRRP